MPLPKTSPLLDAVAPFSSPSLFTSSIHRPTITPHFHYDFYSLACFGVTRTTSSGPHFSSLSTLLLLLFPSTIPTYSLVSIGAAAVIYRSRRLPTKNISHVLSAHYVSASKILLPFQTLRPYRPSSCPQGKSSCNLHERTRPTRANNYLRLSKVGWPAKKSPTFQVSSFLEGRSAKTLMLIP